MSLKLRHPALDEKAKQATGSRVEADKSATSHLHPPEQQPFPRRSGVVFVELLPGFAACVGFFLLLVGLAEHPPASRIAVEVTLLIPLTFLIVWSIIKRVRK